MRRCSSFVICMMLAGCSSATTIPPNAAAPESKPLDALRARAAAASRMTATHGPARVDTASNQPREWWKDGVAYVSPTSTGYVYVYPGSLQPPTKTLFSFNLYPGVENSIQIDAHQNVYFADSYSDWDFEYKPDSNVPFKRFETALTPSAVAVYKNWLYSLEGDPSGTGGVLLEIYKNGSTSASEQIGVPGSLPESIAIDGSGDALIATDAGLLELPSGSKTVQTISSGYEPLALAIDQHGDVLADDIDGETSSIDTFPPGKNTPTKSIAHLPWFYQISLTRDGKRLYAGESGYGSHAYDFYYYPSGKEIYTFTPPGAYSGVAGIAASPAIVPGTW